MSAEAFQFHHRWSTIATRGLKNSLSELEARDQALEQFIKDFPCGGTVPTFEFEVASEVLAAAIFSSGSGIQTAYTLTWIADVDYTPESIRYTVDVLSSPATVEFGTYDSGYPGTLTPIEGVSLTMPGSGSGNTTYSGFTTIPVGSICGIKVYNVGTAFNLINTLQVIVSGSAAEAHPTVFLNWHS